MASLYFRKTNDLITSYHEPGTNPFTGHSAIINAYVNANSSQTYGAELSSQNYKCKTCKKPAMKSVRLFRKKPSFALPYCDTGFYRLVDR